MPPPRGILECHQRPRYVTPTSEKALAYTISGDFIVTKDVHNDTYPAIDPTQHDLAGKAVFISGATRGIGRATSISFAKAGASFIAIGARSDLKPTETAIKEAAKATRRSEPKVL